MSAGRPLSSLNIALVGCGKMGGAMLRGWMDSGIGSVTVIEPYPLPFTPGPTITHYTNADDAAGPWDGVIIAVKPQVMKDVCASLSTKLSAATPILSIAAGQTIAAFQSYFAPTQPVIRAMPNTPASIAKGMIVACPSAQITPDQRSMADALLRPLGLVSWVNDEGAMDAVTALSGSGPAYVFYLIEVLTDAGIAAGLDGDFAATLARQTVIGSAALADHDAELSAATLRQNVTSPGGTTEAALGVLMDGRVQQIFNDALAAATKRSRELSR